MDAVPNIRFLCSFVSSSVNCRTTENCRIDILFQIVALDTDDFLRMLYMHHFAYRAEESCIVLSLETITKLREHVLLQMGRPGDQQEEGTHKGNIPSLLFSTLQQK